MMHCMMKELIFKHNNMNKSCVLYFGGVALLSILKFQVVQAAAQLRLVQQSPKLMRYYCSRTTDDL